MHIVDIAFATLKDNCVCVCVCVCVCACVRACVRVFYNKNYFFIQCGLFLTAYTSMHQHIVKSGITSQFTYDHTHINAITVSNTEIDTIMFT